jgi:hypothetical protein
VSFGFFFGFLGIFDWIFGFSGEKLDDFERKIVVTTWWLSAKSWSFDGCCKRRERIRMVRPEGVEPPTYWFVASCSIQLSYGRTLQGMQLLKDNGIRGLEQPPASDETLVRKDMVRPERFELPTLWFEAKCSIQLSYGREKQTVQT